MNIPESYQTLMPYLILNDAAGFLSFTERVFGAKEKLKYMRDEKTIMHAEISIGGDSTIMFADATEEFKVSTAGLFIYGNMRMKLFKKQLMKEQQL